MRIPSTARKPGPGMALFGAPRTQREIPSAVGFFKSSEPVRVFLSSHLRDYTGGRAATAGAGGNLIALMDDLDRQYPRLKFRLVDQQGRLRPHLNVFNQLPIRNLRKRLSADDRIDILAALSGG